MTDTIERHLFHRARLLLTAAQAAWHRPYFCEPMPSSSRYASDRPASASLSNAFLVPSAMASGATGSAAVRFCASRRIAGAAIAAFTFGQRLARFLLGGLPAFLRAIDRTAMDAGFRNRFAVKKTISCHLHSSNSCDPNPMNQIVLLGKINSASLI